MGLYPTLTELPGLPRPTSTAVVPFADAVRDPKAPGSTAVFSEYNLRGRPCQYMLRDARYKYIHNEGSLDELYDLLDDADEYHNLAKHPEFRGVLTALHQQLLRRYNPGTNPLRPAR